MQDEVADIAQLAIVQGSDCSDDESNHLFPLNILLVVGMIFVHLRFLSALAPEPCICAVDSIAHLIWRIKANQRELVIISAQYLFLWEKQ